MIGTINSFTGKLKLWKTQLMKGVLTHFPRVQLMKGVLTHFPRVQSHIDGTFDVSVYILCIDELLKEFFEDLRILST
jgi:hypothetical protein